MTDSPRGKHPKSRESESWIEGRTVFKGRGKMEQFVERIYDSGGNPESSAADRITMLPHLTSIQIEQLTQLVSPTYDGSVISKSVRSELVDMNLAARWNGLNFITQAGMCVLDTLGILGDHSQFGGGLKRAKSKNYQPK